MSVLVDVLTARLRALMELHGHSPRSISVLRVERSGTGSPDGWAQRRFFSPGSKGSRAVDFAFMGEVCALLGETDGVLLRPVVDQLDLVVLRWVDARQPTRADADEAWPPSMIGGSRAYPRWRTSAPQRLLDQRLIQDSDGALSLTEDGRRLLEAHPPE